MCKEVLYLKQMEGPLFLFGAFTLAGTSVISAQYVSAKLGTFTITAVSLLFALLFLIPLCFGRLKRELPSLSRRDWFYLMVQALFGMFLFRMFLIIGLMRTSAGEAGILTGATPAITATLAWCALKEPVGGKRFLGILCTIGGVLLIQGLFPSRNGLSMEHLAGNLLVLCAAASESLFNILSRFFARRQESAPRKALDPIVQTAVVSAIAMILCLAPAIFENPGTRLAALNGRGWFALVWYGVFVTALAFICWYSGIKRCGAITAAAFSGMMPFTAMLLSALLLKERSGLHQWAGGMLVIAGIILIGISRYGRKEEISEPDK